MLFTTALLKNGKAVGIDMIPNEQLKHKVVVKLLHRLFNLCWENKLVLDKWRDAIIHPIPKTTLLSMNPLDYRGLALQSCIHKIFSSILNARIVKYMEVNGILADEQNGFRKKRSCLHHVHNLTSLVKTRISDRCITEQAS